MSKIKMHYRKWKKPSPETLEVLNKQYMECYGGDEEVYKPFKISNIQNYNPCFDLFFEMNESNYDSITLNHKYCIKDLKTVLNMESNKDEKKDVFVKFAPLLDPIHYLIGKYSESKDVLRTLPKFNSSQDQSTPIFHKLQDRNNASYVDNFFYFLSSNLLNHHNCSHGIDYFGSFSGIQDKYNFNATDDIDYLIQSPYFTENRDGLYEFDNESAFQGGAAGSHKFKPKLDIENDCLLDDIEEIVLDDSENVVDEAAGKANGNLSCVFENNVEDVADDSSDDSNINYSDDEDDEDDEEEEEEDDTEWENCSDDDSAESEEENVNVLIRDFPVQMICLEKCQGTLDELFENQELDLDSIASALFQIIMTLIIYQKAYHFTHNDLHTNNIMYVETQEEFIYYCYKNKYYKVPTYGKIYKIIDFGRAIYKYEGHIFCSDSFAPSGDANTQYNCEPYFVENRPRIEPNYSFDLCRLGCSIYDFIMEIKDEHNKKFKPDALQETIIRWCRDDNGKNVLYMKNGDERYEEFKLYKMIARTVHNHVPEAQLDYAFFSQFKVDEKRGSCINIDAIPCYV